jgi:hypothetical protein
MPTLVHPKANLADISSKDSFLIFRRRLPQSKGRRHTEKGVYKDLEPIVLKGTEKKLILSDKPHYPPRRGGEKEQTTLREAYPQAYPEGAICVQRFDDSQNSAIRITYRISLRSSSLREPRHPLLRVVLIRQLAK